MTIMKDIGCVGMERMENRGGNEGELEKLYTCLGESRAGKKAVKHLRVDVPLI